ncbi:MAG TPA: hypothetical protein PLB25_21285 [Rhodoferax sp.]|nr:hypothetical protein [Rhodoferax sp.]
MHLFVAIIDVNHRAVTSDGSEGLRPVEFADALPAEQFIWLRNAGNIITNQLSCTTTYSKIDP